MLNRLLFVFILLIFSLTSLAQDETYTWQLYGLTVTMPDGWVISPTEMNDLLVLMPDQDALEQTVAGNEANLPVISIATTGNISGINDELFDAVSSRQRIDGTPDSNGFIMAADFMPESQTRRTDMIQLNSHYVLFASAPRDLWDDFAPELETFLGSIVDAPLYEVTVDMLLTQPVNLGGVSLMIPADWNVASAGVYHNLRLLVSERERRTIAATFVPNELSIEVRDLTAMRAVLTEDILFTVRLLYYAVSRDTDAVEVTSLGTTTRDDTLITGIAYTSGSQAGQAYYIRNPDFAYVIAGIANPDMWETSEKALFEAIFATLTVE